MNSRIVNAEGYIFSAIVYAGMDKFTGNDIAKILTEQFALPRNLFGARAFTYNQLESLIKKGALTKLRRKGINQYDYTKTSLFQEHLARVELIPPVAIPSPECERIWSGDNHDKAVDPVSWHKLNVFLRQYEADLARLSGEKEVYDQLITELPEYEDEFRTLSYELNRNTNRLTGKISALEKVIKHFPALPVIR